MHIQAIQGTVGRQNNYKSHVSKVNAKQKNVSFKSFEKLLAESAIKGYDFDTMAIRTFCRLVRELEMVPNIKTTKEYGLLKEEMLSDTMKSLQKLSNPIAKVPSEWRDIVLDERAIIPLMKNDDGIEFRLCNYGKRGFFNFFFNSQDAKSDIRYVFDDYKNKNNMEFGLTKEGGLYVEGNNGFVRYVNKFSDFLGELTSRKSNDVGLTTVW